MQKYDYFFITNIFPANSHGKLKKKSWPILPHKIVLLLNNIPCSCEYPVKSLFENISSCKTFSVNLLYCIIKRMLIHVTLKEELLAPHKERC